jgi:hypothetical protein
VPSLGARAKALPPSIALAPRPAPRVNKDRRETSIVMRFLRFCLLFCAIACALHSARADGRMLRRFRQASKWN